MKCKLKKDKMIKIRNILYTNTHLHPSTVTDIHPITAWDNWK